MTVGAAADGAAASGAADRLLAGVAGSAGLDRLVGLAARLLSAPSSQVSLLTSVQTVAAGRGLPAGAVGGQAPAVGSLCTVTAGLGGPLVVADARVDDRVSGLPPVTSGSVGSYLGVPLVTAAGLTVGALCVFGPDPRRWTGADVTVLQELAGAVMAELELAALSAEYTSSRLRWDVALDAAGIGSFDWDLTGDRVDWDERLQALFGYEPGQYVPHLSEAFSRVHPQDRPTLDDAIAGAVAGCGPYRAEFRVELPGGGQRWVAARGHALCDGAGTAVRLIGTCHDVTEVRRAADQQAKLLETMATGFLSVDRDWQVTYLNTAGARVVGYTAAQLVGRSLWEAFPGLAEAEFGRQYRQAVATGQTVQFEAFYDHLQRWYEVRAVPDDTGLGLYFLDITARRADQQQARREQARAQAEQARAQVAVARLELLARVSTELAAASLHSQQAVDRLAELVVPALADWSIVTLLDDDGSVTHAGSWHSEPDLRPVAQAYATHRFDGIDPYTPVIQARSTGRPVVLAAGAAERAAALLQSEPARDALRQLAPESAVVLPLTARGHVAGTLSLCRGAERPPLDAQELTLAGEIAARAGQALDNARLYAQQRGLAETLQRSLLTDPAQPPHGQIVVRYAPAAETASVGGDWFDAFLHPDGATTLVIGDVVGHDTQAAAAMGQVRGLLRGIAFDSGAAPASVLSRLDAALEGLQVHTTASAVTGRLEQTPQMRQHGTVRWRWSNAGHPPPVVLHPDGTVAVLTGPSVDLLLGIDPGTDRTEHQVMLQPGATVLLYTDGLIERRGEDLDTGLIRLRDTLTELAGLDLDRLCDTLLTRLASGADDDVALLAFRVHRHEQHATSSTGTSSTAASSTSRADAR